MLFFIDDIHHVGKCNYLSISCGIYTLDDDLKRALGLWKYSNLAIFCESKIGGTRNDAKNELFWSIVGYIEFELLIEEKCWNGLFGNV